MGYNVKGYSKTGFRVNKTVEGEPIERKIERIVSNGEPIKDGAPIIFTEKAEGVKAGYNIRTDRFDVALDGIDKIAKSATAKRENVGKVVDMKGGEVTGGESTQGTGN